MAGEDQFHIEWQSRALAQIKRVSPKTTRQSGGSVKAEGLVCSDAARRYLSLHLTSPSGYMPLRAHYKQAALDVATQAGPRNLLGDESDRVASGLRRRSHQGILVLGRGGDVKTGGTGSRPMLVDE